MKLILTPKAPFNFDLVASLYSRFPTQCVDLYSQGLKTFGQHQGYAAFYLINDYAFQKYPQKGLL